MYNPLTDEYLRTQIDSIFQRYDREQSGSLPLVHLQDYCNEVFIMCATDTVVSRDQAWEALNNVYPHAQVLNKQILLAVLKEVRWMDNVNRQSRVIPSEPQQQLPRGYYHTGMPPKTATAALPLVGGPPIYQQPISRHDAVSSYPPQSQYSNSYPELSVSTPWEGQLRAGRTYEQPPIEQTGRSIVFDVPDRLPPSPRSNPPARSPARQY